MRSVNRILLPLALSTVLLSSGGVAGAQQPGPTASQVQADAQKQLHGKQFRNVQVQVADGVATLTGQVDKLSDKLDATKRIARMHETASIQNNIEVRGAGNVSDAELFQKIGKQLASVGEGYGRVAFEDITLQMQNGVATLGGVVVDPVDKDTAVGDVTDSPGVRDLVDHLEVAPVSPNDWQLRRALYNAIYGAPQLNKYAINPLKPIRIIVVNGRCTLAGVVDNKGDKEIAGIRANGVGGVFAVTNDLQVEGQGNEP